MTTNGCSLFGAEEKPIFGKEAILNSSVRVGPIFRGEVRLEITFVNLSNSNGVGVQPFNAQDLSKSRITHIQHAYNFHLIAQLESSEHWALVLKQLLASF